MIDLDRIERLAREATPGPWEVTPNSANGKEEAWCYWHKVGPFHLDGKEPDADSLYVAALDPQTVLNLIAVVRAAQNLQAQKGRHHTAVAYKQLIEALEAMK